MHIGLITKHEYDKYIIFVGDTVNFRSKNNSAIYKMGHLVEAHTALESLARSNYENFDTLVVALKGKIKAIFSKRYFDGGIDTTIIFWQHNANTISWDFCSRKEAVIWLKDLIDAFSDYSKQRETALQLLGKKNLIGTIKLDHEECCDA